MDTMQIKNVMKNNFRTKNYFKGVFPSDKLPKTKMHKPSCIIVNTDPSSKPGTHWVAIYFPKTGNAEYFDSFGMQPKIKSILKFISFNSKKYTFNRTQLQNVFSIVCGNYCCEYLLHRCMGKSKSSFLKNYKVTNTLFNDELTKKKF